MTISKPVLSVLFSFIYTVLVVAPIIANSQQTFTFLNNTVFVRIINNGNQTSFYFTSSLGGLSSSDSWLAVALSNNQLMISSYAYICRYSAQSKSIKQYFSATYSGPTLLEDSNPFFPLFDTSVSVIGGNLSCSFSRWNVYQGKPFYELYQLANSRKPYILVAYGSGNVSYHGKNREASSYPADIDSTFYLTNVNGSNSTSKFPIDSSIINFFNDQKTFLQKIYTLVVQFLNLFGIKL
jgi:hypothetical protein